MSFIDLFRERQQHVQILLKCPDGFEESLGFDIPKELPEFLAYISDVSSNPDWKGYSIKARVMTTEMALSELLGSLVKSKGELKCTCKFDGCSNVIPSKRFFEKPCPVHGFLEDK